MYDNDSKGISYTGGFFMLIGFAVAGLFLASLISTPIWQVMTGTGIKNLEKGMTDPANADAVKLMQVINAVVGFLLPAFLTAAVLHRRPMKLLGFSSGIRLNQAFLTLLIIIAAVSVSSGLSYFNNHIPIPASWRIAADRLEADYNRQVEAIISLKTPGEYVLALIIMAFLPALCEETLFRGGFQNFLNRGTGKPWFAIIAVSLLFSLAHFSYYGFLSRFFLGVILGLIYHYSGRLWLSILAHFIHNAAALTILYISMKNGTPLRQVLSDNATTSYLGILALPIVIGLFFLLRKTSPRSRAF
jgi:membrane protease YdiL (CAAX protease family)